MRILGGHRERRHVGAEQLERLEHAADRRRLQGRQIALQIDHARKAPLGVDPPERLEDPVGARGQIGIGQHAGAAMRLDRLGDRRLAAGHDHGADLRLARAAPDLDDHRRAADLGERLVGQARGAQARRNHDDGRLGRHRLDDHGQIGQACVRSKARRARLGRRGLGQIAAAKERGAAL